MPRLPLILTVTVAATAVSACGELDLAKAGRNAAWAAVEASNPELAQGLRAAQTLKQAAATCGWEDVDAAALARAGLAGVEDPGVRAAAASLIDDLLVADTPAAANAGTTASTDCSPEARQALEAQIAAIANGEAEAEAEGG